MPHRHWTEVVATKRTTRDAQIKEQQPNLDARNDHVTSIADVEYLTRLIEKKDLFAEDIVKAYILKCVSQMTGDIATTDADIGPAKHRKRYYRSKAPGSFIKLVLQTNCLTEVCFRDAIGQAKALDDFHKKHGRLMGPLHGVVMSVKDQFNIQGLDSTLGYASRAGYPATSDSLLVQVLKQLGAVIIAKTN